MYKVVEHGSRRDVGRWGGVAVVSQHIPRAVLAYSQEQMGPTEPWETLGHGTQRGKVLLGCQCRMPQQVGEAFAVHVIGSGKGQRIKDLSRRNRVFVGLVCLDLNPVGW